MNTCVMNYLLSRSFFQTQSGTALVESTLPPDPETSNIYPHVPYEESWLTKVARGTYVINKMK